jgi:hypothetical protein
MGRREKQEAAPLSLPLQPSGLSGQLLPVTPRVRSAPALHLSLSGPYLPYFVTARRERRTVRQPAPLAIGVDRRHNVAVTDPFHRCTLGQSAGPKLRSMPTKAAAVGFPRRRSSLMVGKPSRDR